MSDPATLDDYNRLFNANLKYIGLGLQTKISVPCPFCCAPDFTIYRIIDAEKAMKTNTTCKSCGRSAKFIFDIDTPGEKQFRLVQTDGPDIPAWLPQIERMTEETTDPREVLMDRYMRAAHGMQAGVAMEMNDPDSAATSPKHLRVGINARASDQKALADLLIAKGVFTELEYIEAMAIAMEQEKARYEHLLSEKLGRPITLL